MYVTYMWISFYRCAKISATVKWLKKVLLKKTGGVFKYTYKVSNLTFHKEVIKLSFNDD